MDYNDQTDELYIDMCNMIHRYMCEFDLNTQTIIGVLEECKNDLVTQGVMFMDIDIDESSEEEEL
jgi:hypothetical protein